MTSEQFDYIAEAQAVASDLLTELYQSIYWQEQPGSSHNQPMIWHSGTGNTEVFDNEDEMYQHMVDRIVSNLDQAPKDGQAWEAFRYWRLTHFI